MTTFSITVMARESREVLKVFIDHYRTLGPRQILIYFDGEPDADVAALAAGNVQITACDRAFWQAHDVAEGADLDTKLSCVFQVALRDCTAEWLLPVDADELLLAPEPLSEFFARVPPEIEVLRLRNHEAVWGPGDPFGELFGCSYLRRVCNPGVPQIMLMVLVYGRSAGMLGCGLAGHASGKQALRTGRHYDVVQSHFTYRDGVSLGRWADNHMPGPYPLIAHFDALSLDRWTEKFRRRQSGESPSVTMRPRRARQMTATSRSAAQSEAAARRMCRRLHGLNRIQYFLLKTAGLAYRHGPIPLKPDET